MSSLLAFTQGCQGEVNAPLKHQSPLCGHDSIALSAGRVIRKHNVRQALRARYYR